MADTRFDLSAGYSQVPAPPQSQGGGEKLDLSAGYAPAPQAATPQPAQPQAAQPPQPAYKPPLEFQSPDTTKPFPEWYERFLETSNKYLSYLEAGAKSIGKVFKGEAANPTSNVPGGPQLFSSEGPVPEGFRAPGFSQAPMGVAGGVGQLMGGVVTNPTNWPFLGSSAARPLLQKLISGGFGVMMGHDAISGAVDLKENWDKYTPEQRAERLTQITGAGAMATASGAHVMAGPEGEVRLTPDEHAYLQGVIQQHLDTGLAEGDLTKIDDATASNSVLNTKPKLSDLEMRALKPFLSRFPQEIAELTAKADAGDVDAQNQLRALLQGTRKANIGPPEGQVDRRANAITANVPEVPQNAPVPEAIPSGIRGAGGEPEVNATPEGGVEAIRNDTGVTRGEGAASADLEQRPVEGANRGEDTQGALLSAIVPDFEKVVGGGEGGGTLPTGAPSGTEALPPNNPDSPPVISEAADNDLANGGISIVRGGEDIGLISRWLGSITQAARRLGNPIFKAIADKLADTSIAIARNTRDSVGGFQKYVRTIVNPKEYDRVVDLLDDPNVNVNNLPLNIPDNIRQAYTQMRGQLEEDRLAVINAKRLELVAGGISAARAKELVTDDYGIKEGYYAHAFPGNWTITAHGGIDEAGHDIWDPIDTGWRATTLSEAQAKAREYLSQNPGSNLKVQLDNVSLPGKGIADRARLQALHDEIKNAATFVHNGANPEGILTDLRETSGALTYGPRRPTPRQFGNVLQREANLPGWVRDMDNYERYLIGIQRYIQLAPARAEILKLRNYLANQSGVAPILKPSEIPKRYSGDYANMLGRTDAAIEALEGYPTGIDAAIRNSLQRAGFDPNLVNSAYSIINQIEAVLKLGFNPASAGLHLAQTLAATYPVLGERWTLHGITHAYSSQYDALVHDLGIEATSNLMDVDSFQAYRGGYLSGITGPATAAKAGFKAVQDTGLFLFSKGVETARRVSAIGAYEKAISEGMDPQQARDYARDTLIRTQFLYSPADQSIFMRNIPRPMGQFKNFTLKMAEFVTGLRGAEIPRFIAALGVIGYAGMPALTALSNATQWLTGYNPENEFKRLLPRFSRGVLGYAGIDYTKNIGFSDWLSGNTLDPSHLLGPGVSDILNLAKGGVAEAKQHLGAPTRSAETDVDNALRNISPEARRLWDEGLRMARGGNLVDPKTGTVIVGNLTPREQLELTLGFTPLRVAEERDSHEYLRNEIEKAKDKRGYFVDKLAENQLELNRPGLNDKQKAELFKETVNLQKLAVEYGQGYKLAPAVRDRMKGMIQERLARDVKGAPKVERGAAFQELQRFRQEQ